MGPVSARRGGDQPGTGWGLGRPVGSQGPRDFGWVLSWVTFLSCTPWKLVREQKVTSALPAPTDGQLRESRTAPARRRTGRLRGVISRAAVTRPCVSCRKTQGKGVPKPTLHGGKSLLSSTDSFRSPRFSVCLGAQEECSGSFFQSPRGHRIVQVGFHNAREWSTQENLHLRDVGKSRQLGQCSIFLSLSLWA